MKAQVKLKELQFRTSGKFYLREVEIVESDNYQEVEDCSYAVPNGTYIERCYCHPNSPFTRVIEVKDGQGSISEEVEIITIAK